MFKLEVANHIQFLSPSVLKTRALPACMSFVDVICMVPVNASEIVINNNIQYPHDLLARMVFKYGWPWDSVMVASSDPVNALSLSNLVHKIAVG
jgi:hypothetical protein